MKAIKILLILAIIAILPSCDSFLEEDTKGRFDESYFLTESGVKNYSVGMYAAAHEIIHEQLWLLGTGGTDELTFGSGSSAEIVTKYDNTTTNMLSLHTSTRNAWLADYSVINYANYGLLNIEKVTLSSSALKDQFIGEYSFFRAWAYWLVVETWGTGAHYTETPTQDASAAGFQTTIDVFYKLIIGDINRAISSLKTSPSKTGELTSGAAKALKARVLMSLAGYDNAIISATGFYANVNDLYTEAKTIADELTASANQYGYRLQDDFAQVFDTDNQQNSEVIWALQMTLDEKYKYRVNIMSKMHCADPCGSLRYTTKSFSLTGGDGLYQHSAWYGRFQGDLMPTYYYVTLFDTDDKRAEGTFETTYQRLYLTTGAQGDMGKPFTNGLLNGPPTDTILYRPLRTLSAAEAEEYMARGIYADGLDFIYDLSVPGAPPKGLRSSNYRKYSNTITKFLDRNRTAPKQENGGKEIIVFRLAEFYLIGAECAYHLSGGAAAVPYIDKLRERARKTPGSLPVVAADIDVDYILDERTREIGGELIRWFDLKRTHKWDRVLKYNPDCTYFDASYCTVRPIPITELQGVSNPDEFVQNPGWN
jgi:hypothetical protein